jgi:hypothetical protein
MIGVVRTDLQIFGVRRRARPDAEVSFAKDP